MKDCPWRFRLGIQAVLRAAFAKEGQATPRTAEQILQAMQERDKPPAERRAGKESGQDRGQDKGHERER